MGKSRYKMTEEKIQKWIREARGKGRKTKYKPWLNVQDVPSLGTLHRRQGIIIPRQFEYLSDDENEYHAALELLHCIGLVEILDVREQYSLLPREETIEIAQALGIKHPTDPDTKCQIVMTTDFVITVKLGFDEIDIARTYKQSPELNKKRVIEKLEIERHYWQRRGINWGIVTEQDIPKIFRANALEFTKYVSLTDSTLSANEIVIITNSLNSIIVDNLTMPLNKLCLMNDEILGFNHGTSLSVAKHLIACGQWKVDLFKPFSPTSPLNWIKE